MEQMQAMNHHAGAAGALLGATAGTKADAADVDCDLDKLEVNEIV